MSYTEQIKQDMYIAMKSGDKVKTNILRTLLASLKQKQIEKLFCPLGFSLGGNHPQEIAVSITAQLLYERDKLFGKTHTRNPVPELKCTS